MMRRREQLLAVAALALGFLAAPPAWALKVGRISLEETGGREVLRVQTDGVAQASVQALDKKLVVVIPGGERSMKTLKVNRNPLRQIRFGREGKDLRLVLDLDRDVPGKLGDVGAKGFDVDLGPAAAKAKRVAKPSAKTESKAAVAAAEAAADGVDSALTGYTCRLVDLALGGDSNRSELVISSDGPASYKPSVKEDGRLFSLLFRNSSLAWSGDPARLKDDSIQSVAVKQLNEGGEAQVRVDVRLAQKLDYSIQRDQNQILLRFDRPERVHTTPKSGDLATPVSLDVQDADLVGVLKTLAEQAGFEYQFTSGLLALIPPASLVTAKIEHRPFSEVADTLLVGANAAFIQQGNTLYFGIQSEIDAKKDRLPLVQRTYEPKYMSVKNCLDVLAANFKRTDQSTLATKVAAVDPRDNSRLLLVGTSEDVATVLAALVRYDVSDNGDAGAGDAGGGQPRTQIFHLEYLDFSDAALITSAITQLYDATGDVAPAPPYIDPTSRTLVVTAKLKYLRKIEKLLQRLDVRPLQVNIEGKIVEVDQGTSSQLGLDWSSSSVQDSGQVDRTTGASLNIAKNSSAFNPGIPTDFTSQLTYATIQNGMNIAARIQAAVSNNKADVISAPNVTTRDGQLATIEIDDTNVSVQSTTTITNGISSQSQTFVTQLIPLSLKVTPKISRTDRRVLMRIDFNLTTPSGAAPSAGAPLPTSVQTAGTNVAVGSGDTAVIGGLVRQNNTTQERKVPVLGDIPLLGMLFKFNSVSKQKKEVIIFITPTIVED